MPHPHRRFLLLSAAGITLGRIALSPERGVAQRPGGVAGFKPPAADFSRGAKFELVAAFPDRQITGRAGRCAAAG